MTTEEAIMWMQETRTGGKAMGYEDVVAACDTAIAALRAQQEQENPKPLTLDELRKMDGEPVWLSALGEDFDDGWYIVVAVDKNRLHCLQLYAMLFFENYGNTWLAYRYKPKEG